MNPLQPGLMKSPVQCTDSPSRAKLDRPSIFPAYPGGTWNRS